LIDKKNFVVPVTFNCVDYFLIFAFELIDLANQLKLLFAEPASSFKPDFTPLIWMILVCYVHSVTYVDVHSSNYKIMST